MLLADYSSTGATLTAGLDAVAAAETMEELREVVPSIFGETLVFALIGPKTHAVVASDSIVGISDRHAGIAERLQDGLDRLAADGIDVGAAQTDLDAAINIVAEAVTAGSVVADQVIGLQPGDEIADPLKDAKATLTETREMLKEARDLARSVAEFVRSQLPQDEG
jgi:hypothetical protein